MVTAQSLWEDNRAIAKACLDHPFVRGIAGGMLDRAAFATYVGQDAVFLEGFARAYALCIAKAPDRRGMEEFKSLLDGVFDELALHGSYAKQWGIDLAPEPLPATTAYTDFLLRVTALEPLAHACAAMTPCMRLYAWLGQELQPVTIADSPYREWVDTYASGDFAALASTLERLLDEHASTADPAAMAVHYATAMRLELGFFDAMTPPPPA